MAAVANEVDRILQAAATRYFFEAPASSASLAPALEDESWSGAALTIVTDGKVGPNVRRSAAGVGNVFLDTAQFFQIDRTRTYRTRFWVRASATANGTFYHTLQQFLANGAYGPTNFGRAPYKPSAVSAATCQVWTEFSQTWAAADWQTGATQIKPEFLLNYGGSAGYWEVQGFELLDVTEVVAALTKATEAFNNAALSTAILNQISSDNFLDRSEKAAVVKEWTAINNEIGGLVSQAAELGVSSADLTAAKSNLDTYLNGLSPVWSDTTQDTAIVRATFNLQFNGYYGYRQTLCNAIYAKTSTMASGVTLSATGVLSGGGTSGQMTNLPVMDYGTGTSSGQRQSNDAPSDFPVGTSRLFKDAYYLGVPGTVANTWCTLETTKQYPNGGGGGGVYQYVLINHLTYRRFAPEAGGAANTWQFWVQDLDRNAYNGDLNASRDISLVSSGTGLTVYGNSATRSGGVAWDASVRSVSGNTGGSSCSFTGDPAGNWMAGLNSDPLQDDSYGSLDYAWYSPANGNLHVYLSGTVYNGGQIISTFVASDELGVMMDGSTVFFTQNGVVKLSLSVPSNPTLYFDSSIVTGGLKGIRFGALTSNNWAAIGGSGKPANNATVGAPSGTNVGSTPATTVESNANSAAAAAANKPVVTVNDFEYSAGSGIRYFTITGTSTGTGTKTYSWTLTPDPDFPGISIRSGANSATLSLVCTSRPSGSFAFATAILTVTNVDTGLSGNDWANVQQNY